MSFKKFNCMILTIFLLFGLANAQIPEGLTINKDFVPGIGLSIGKVFMLDGTAIVVHDGQNTGYHVFKGMLLYQKDTLYTKNPGRVLLNMQDDSQLTIGSQSQLTLNKIRLMPRKKMRKSFISMRRGKARFNVRKLSKFNKTDYKVKTQTALIGVRGSDFFVTANRTSTSVTSFDNTKLAIIGLAKPQLPPTILNDFQRVHVDSGDQPSDIEHVSPDEIQRIKTEIKPVEKDQTESDRKQETDSDTDSKTEDGESTKTTDQQPDEQYSETASSSANQVEQQSSEETKSEAPSSESPSQETVLIPTQEIVAPSSIEQAQPPNTDQVVTNVSAENRQNQTDDTSDQAQKIYEQLHENEVRLPSFPGTP